MLPDGHTLPTRSEVVEFDGSAPGPRPFAPRWFVEREAGRAFPAKVLNPSSAEAVPNARVISQRELGDRIELNNATDMRAIGLGLHAVIAAELINPGLPDAAQRAREILEGEGVAVYLKAEDALAAAARFRAYLHESFDVKRILVEWPISHALDNGQLVKGWVDVLVETHQGFVIIDHKSSPRPKSEWRQEALEYSGQLKAYKDAIEAAGKMVVGCWIHFPVSAGMVEITVDRGSITL